MSNFAKNIMKKHTAAMKEKKYDERKKEKKYDERKKENDDYILLRSFVRRQIEKNSNNEYIHFRLSSEYDINARRRVFKDIFNEFKDIANIYKSFKEDEFIIITNLIDSYDIYNEIREGTDEMFIIRFSDKCSVGGLKQISIEDHKYLVSDQ